MSLQPEKTIGPASREEVVGIFNRAYSHLAKDAARWAKQKTPLTEVQKRLLLGFQATEAGIALVTGVKPQAENALDPKITKDYFVLNFPDPYSKGERIHQSIEGTPIEIVRTYLVYEEWLCRQTLKNAQINKTPKALRKEIEILRYQRAVLKRHSKPLMDTLTGNPAGEKARIALDALKRSKDKLAAGETQDENWIRAKRALKRRLILDLSTNQKSPENLGCAIPALGCAYLAYSPLFAGYLIYRGVEAGISGARNLKKLLTRTGRAGRERFIPTKALDTANLTSNKLEGEYPGCLPGGKFIHDLWLTTNRQGKIDRDGDKLTNWPTYSEITFTQYPGCLFEPILIGKEAIVSIKQTGKNTWEHVKTDSYRLTSSFIDLSKRSSLSIVRETKNTAGDFYLNIREMGDDLGHGLNALGRYSKDRGQAAWEKIKTSGDQIKDWYKNRQNHPASRYYDGLIQLEELSKKSALVDPKRDEKGRNRWQSCAIPLILPLACITLALLSQLSSCEDKQNIQSMIPALTKPEISGNTPWGMYLSNYAYIREEDFAAIEKKTGTPIPEELKEAWRFNNAYKKLTGELMPATDEKANSTIIRAFHYFGVDTIYDGYDGYFYTIKALNPNSQVIFDETEITDHRFSDDRKVREARISASAQLPNNKQALSAILGTQ